MSAPPPDKVAAGHAFYTKRALAFYDPAILWYFSRFAWKCPAPVILAHYDRHVSGNHLDVGVGTGYFLDHCTYPVTTPRIGLMDLNENCLDVAGSRIARHQPERFVANVLETIPLDPAPFDSVGLNYLLHCLPGTILDKAVVFENLKVMTNPGAVMFGSTLLHGGVPRNFLARQVMARNNAHGIFCNADDDLAGLRRVLAEQLQDATVTTVGCVAFFSGRV